ncbi:hypothetical protein LTR09_009043 [Extremus antarcticus]|uniref:F-box domain-containing protein n=1 Tax=Extremus antarcticus TaxID=702011 RepID=A0AAJ0D9Q4_9PEZI|nr:hypothetical protein LTR09_009043 [Extremus antarcticus]
MSPTQLYGLPTELLVAVATHLSALEIVRLGRVDRYLYDFVKRHGKFVATAIARRETVRLLEEHEHLNFKDVPLDVAMRRYNEKFGWPWDFFPPQGRPYGSWHVFVHFCKGFARANPGMWMDGYLGELHVGWVADVLIQVSNSMECHKIEERLRPSDRGNNNLVGALSHMQHLEPRLESAVSEVVKTSRYGIQLNGRYDALAQLIVKEMRAPQLAQDMVIGMLKRIDAEPLIDMPKWSTNGAHGLSVYYGSGLLRMDCRLSERVALPGCASRVYEPWLGFPDLKVQGVNTLFRKTGDLSGLPWAALLEETNVFWYY